MKTACILLIGNEILSGRTQDQNAPYLAARLGELGVKVMEMRVIRDDEAIIVEAVNSARATHDYVFTTGGIGPTHDDITSASVAKAFGVPLVRSHEAEALLRGRYKPEDITEARMKMATVPEGASLIDNPVSVAPGFQIENVFVLAGIPRIMKAMFEGLKGGLVGGAPVLSISIDAFFPEGIIAEPLGELQARYPDVDIGSYPFFRGNQPGTCLVARCADGARLAGADLRETVLKALAAKRLERYRRHIESIADKLDKIRKRTEQGRLHGKDEIGVRVGRVIDKYKVAKHFVLHIEDDSFDFEVNQEKVDAEAALDGIYVVRTSVEKKTMDTDQAVRSYKQLSNVERAFRCLKSVDLMVRPIWHRLEDRVRAHIFLCVLAYYVQWHMIEAWRPLLFADEDQQAKASRDPVAPAKRSEAAMEKVHTKRLEDGSPAHSFRTLLKHLGKLVRNTCRLPNAGPEAATFHKTTTPNAKQQKALDLLRGISV